MDLLDNMQNLTIEQDNYEDFQLLKAVGGIINYVHTEIVYAEFSDKTLLIVSQYKKAGTMVLVQKDEIHSPLGNKHIYTSKILFGTPGEEQQAAARYLAEGINIAKPLCFFINLQSYDVEVVKAITAVVLEIRNGNQL